jgi:hypothetical protein
LPEWLLMLIYFTIWPFIFIFLICWNTFNIFMEAVSNLTLPFRESNTKHNGNGISFEYIAPKKDSTGKIIDPTSEWWRPWSICELNKYKSDNNGWFFGTITKIIDYTGNGLMFMVYAMITMQVIMPISLIVSVFGLINPLLRKYKLDKDIDENKLHGIGDFIRDTFVYKKTFIIFLAAYNLLMSTGVYLEAGYTFSCFVGILILVLYFEVLITPDASKINADDITQQIFNNNEYSNMKQFKQKPNGNIFEPCKASTSNKTNKTETGEGQETGEGPDTYKNQVDKKKTELSDLAKTNVGNFIRPKTAQEIAAKLDAKNNANREFTEKGEKLFDDAKKKVISLKEETKKIGTALYEAPGNIKNVLYEAPGNLKTAVKLIPDEITATRQSIANDLLNSISTQKAGSILNRNKNGALHKKYNFSLV